jgi:hypothetical protein
MLYQFHLNISKPVKIKIMMLRPRKLKNLMEEHINLM